MGVRRLQGIRWMTIDYERDELRVAADDGRIVRQAGGVQRPDGPFDFKSVTFKPADLTLEVVTPWDEHLEVEVFANDDQLLRRAGRPVIYLDQNKWVQVAMALHRPERVRPPSELAPTLRVIEMARGKEVLLPISSGHWIETGPLEGHRRAHVASLMVGLSRGWIMRDPPRVAALEMATLFGNDEHGRSGENGTSVFTLDAGALFAEPTTAHVLRHDGLPSDVGDVIEALSGVQSILAVLLEDERTKDPNGVQKARQWADIYQAWAQQLASQRLSASRLRRQTLEAFIKGLGHGLAEVARAHGIGSADLEAWVDEGAERDLCRLPYLGLSREVTHARLRDANDRWHRHDLVDMLYLPCAAAHGDFVVAEKKMAHYLQRTTRDRSTCVVVASFADLIAALEP